MTPNGRGTKDGVFSLEDWSATRARFGGEDAGDDGTFLEQTVSAAGDYRTTDGTTLAADVGMIRKPLDVSKMTMEWVQSTEDTLFGDLERADRHLLYLYFARERRDVVNWPGLLMAAIPAYFDPPATELSRYRRELEQSRELDRRRETDMAQAILSDPNEPESSKQWAREILVRCWLGGAAPL
jgi:hypothetical protein